MEILNILSSSKKEQNILYVYIQPEKWFLDESFNISLICIPQIFIRRFFQKVKYARDEIVEETGNCTALWKMKR